MVVVVVAPDKRQDDERPATHTARFWASHGCSQCIGSLRFDGQPGQAGAGQGGKQKLSRTSDKLQAASWLMML